MFIIKLSVGILGVNKEVSWKSDGKQKTPRRHRSAGSLFFIDEKIHHLQQIVPIDDDVEDEIYGKGKHQKQTDFESQVV